ncbi:MAG TPA: YtxH domain-containing protein [Patescibacteria group bacterium]|nr:YtxH domain-containing protein [Patescibacteria group bacterium]
MTHHDNQKKHQSHIWFGFTLGSVIGATGLFLIGTTQGRKLLKKAMEIAEHLETSAEDVITHLENTVEEKGQKIKDIVEPFIEHTPLHSVLQKIQTVLPQNHTSEKSSMKRNHSLK